MYDKYDRNSQYFVKQIESTHDDYKLIRKSFEDTMLGSCTVETHKIFRVVERNSDERSEQKNRNMLLFHGTNLDGVVGILQEGFRPSTAGHCGPGVYLTASSNVAAGFSASRTLYSGRQLNPDEKQNNILSVVVSEVLESEKIQFSNKACYSRKSHFKKYVYIEAAENDYYDTYEKDSSGRKIRISRPNKSDVLNEYVCHETYVIPRYIIQFFKFF